MASPALAPKTASIWERLAELPLVVEAVSCRQLELAVSPEFTRLTTEVTLAGQGAEGRGEDVAYQPEVQRPLPAHIAGLPLAGTWTLGSFSAHLETLELAPEAGTWDDHPNYHRWALESAALDLALRQSGTRLADVTGRPVQPMQFCISMGLGSPPSTAKVRDWLALHPGLEFKIDASREWTDELVAELAATGAVRVVDIKGMYAGEWIDNTPDPELYARIATGLPDVTIEDPKLLDETRAALGEDGLRRVSWDAPLHSVADIEAAAQAPAAVNIKPSRFGTVREVLAAIAWGEERGIPLYAGGQFELGYGRTQSQLLAATFYPHSANDIAPAAWHTAGPGDTVPLSPLTLPDGPGFGFDA